MIVNNTFFWDLLLSYLESWEEINLFYWLHDYIKEDRAAYKAVFEFIESKAGHNSSHIMADAAPQIRSAAESVFSPDTQMLMCFFHVLQKAGKLYGFFLAF